MKAAGCGIGMKSDATGRPLAQGGSRTGCPARRAEARPDYVGTAPTRRSAAARSRRVCASS